MKKVMPNKKTETKEGKSKLAMRCPVCTKRAFDISDLPANLVLVELNCPHCRNIVQVPCTKDAAIN